MSLNQQDSMCDVFMKGVPIVAEEDVEVGGCVIQPRPYQITYGSLWQIERNQHHPIDFQPEFEQKSQKANVSVRIRRV